MARKPREFELQVPREVEAGESVVHAARECQIHTSLLNKWQSLKIAPLTIISRCKDFALTGSKNLAELLKKRGIKQEFHLSRSGHTWINWRSYLRDYAQLLFR